MSELPETDSQEQTHRRMRKLKDSRLAKELPFTVGGSMGVGCSVVVMLPGTYAAFQDLFNSGISWGITALCLLGGITGGLAQVLSVRYGVPGNKQMPNFMATPIVGVATGIAVMVGTGIATGVYKFISGSTGWGIHTIATFVLATCLMYLLGGSAGRIAHMFFKIIEKEVTASRLKSQ